MSDPKDGDLDRIKPPELPPPEEPDQLTRLEIAKLSAAEYSRYTILVQSQQLDRVREQQHQQIVEQAEEIKQLHRVAEKCRAVEQAHRDTRRISGWGAVIMAIGSGSISSSKSWGFYAGWGLVASAALLVLVQSVSGDWHFWKKRPPNPE